MEGYKDLSQNRFQLKLGQTSRLYHEGKTPEVIALIVKRPVEDVIDWIENIIKVADLKRAELNR